MITTPAHYVKENQQCRIPRRWVYLDTETYLVGDGGRHELRWRLGVTIFEHRDNHGKQWVDPEVKRWTNDLSMWAYIDSCTKPKARTVVVAHNIGFDIRVSDALTHLPALGWTMKMMSIGWRNLTMTWTKDGATMLLVDFMSWVPKSLADIGVMIGKGKLPMPDWEASDDTWFTYCERDAWVLRDANRELVDWVESENLGNWQRTGAGMAWSNWRHVHLSHKVLVHADETARDAEAVGVATARCEAWRWGKNTTGPYVEWDFPMAYASVCLTAELPTSLMSHHWNPKWSSFSARSPGQRALLTATVTTEVPTLPVKSEAGWLWPVGTFTSTWWEDEVHNAVRYGATVELHHAITYKAAPILAEWATWVCGVVNDPTAAYSPLQRAWAKHASRALIGRFGARFPLWEPWGAASRPGIDLAGFYDMDTGQLGQMLNMGGECFVAHEKDWTADAMPAVMGAVMSECRIRLWTVLQVAGLDNVVYCDTDSVIVNREGDRRLAEYTDHGQGWGIRPKGRYRSLEVMGPRQMVIDGKGRISGVSKKAHRADTSTWVGEKWDGVTTTLMSGSPNTVVIRDTVWKVPGIDRRRVHVPGGTTENVRVHP